MANLYITFSLSSMILFLTKGQNVTSPRRGLSRDVNAIAILQQIVQQLNTLQTESHRQSTNIQDISRALTRVEVQRQDLVSTIDRAESRLSQRLDDIKGDIRKVATLQEVLREDVDKMEQNQLINKGWLERYLTEIGEIQPTGKPESSSDPSLSLSTSSDVLANIQIVQTTLYNLRRMTDTLQNNIVNIRANISDLTNLTRLIYHHSEEVVTKAYLLTTIRNMLEEKDDNSQLLTCPSSQQYTAEFKEQLPKDCQELQKLSNDSGIYRIQPAYAQRPFFAFCDMETEGGGWTVIQRRKDGSVDFLREWNDYKHGFGNVGGEFWLGNEKIHQLTNQDLYEIRIELQDFEDEYAYAKYEGFVVGNEKERYMLKLLGKISGDAGDGLSYHASMPFSTVDADNDHWAGGSCAKDHTGGWWYNQCDASNLNGQYLGGMTQQEYKGVYWYEWQGPNYSLRTTEMKIRPIRNNQTRTAI